MFDLKLDRQRPATTNRVYQYLSEDFRLRDYPFCLCSWFVCMDNLHGEVNRIVIG
jgi:hypothetical protein